MPKPGQSRACARESRRWQATSERPEPSGSGKSTEVEHPSPVVALAEARPFPDERGETSKNDARCAQGASLRRAPATACCKDNGHSLSFSGWSAPAETRATQQPKPWRPEPSRPNTGEAATIARHGSTSDSPKTHRPSKPGRFLGHLRLDSPAKVGRLATCPECLPPSTEPVSSAAAACWRSHPYGACQAGTWNHCHWPAA